MKNLKRLAVAIMLASVFLGGCGPSIQELCEDKFACDGDGSVEQCVTDIEAAEEASDRIGCGGEYDDVLSCGADTAECVNGQYDSSDCGPELSEFRACVQRAED